MIMRTENLMLAAGILAMLIPAKSKAHDLWIDAEDMFTAPGSQLTVHICGGHHFPECDFAVKEQMIGGLYLRSPDGPAVLVETTAADKMRTGSVRIDTAAVHLLTLSLFRGKLEEPVYEMKTLIIPPGCEDDPALYESGEGFEIVPAAPVTGTGKEDELPLCLMLDGERIEGEIVVFPEHGRASYLKTDAEEAAVLSIGGTGRYLAVASVDGRQCSLVLMIREENGK